MMVDGMSVYVNIQHATINEMFAALRMDNELQMINLASMVFFSSITHKRQLYALRRAKLSELERSVEATI